MAQLPGKLSHIGAKVARSIEHFQTLDSEIAAFLDSKPCQVIRQFDAEQRSYSYRAKPIKEIPLHIRVLTGEVLCQLRSALDHLVWQLALLETSDPQPSTEFPIFKDRARYRSDRARKIGSIPTAAKNIIDNLQPYLDQASEDNVLWKLHRLSNGDKHRLPHLAFAAPKGIWMGKPPPDVPDHLVRLGFSDTARRGRSFGIAMRIGPFEAEQEIGTITFNDPNETDLEVEDVYVNFDLTFASGSAAKGRPIRDELRAYGQRVEEIVRKFVAFF